MTYTFNLRFQKRKLGTKSFEMFKSDFRQIRGKNVSGTGIFSMQRMRTKNSREIFVNCLHGIYKWRHPFPKSAIFVNLRWGSTFAFPALVRDHSQWVVIAGRDVLDRHFFLPFCIPKDHTYWRLMCSLWTCSLFELRRMWSMECLAHCVAYLLCLDVI